MMVAVLLGALSLGACVDDNESASVTDLREAKAEQLRSVAALNQAKADAEAVLAAAEADYKAAQAEYERARAAAENASAEETQFNLQKAQEKYAMDIEEARLEHQMEMARLQHELEMQQGTFDDEEYSRLTILYNRYYVELNNLTTLQSSLVDQQAQLAMLEANVISSESWNAYNNYQQQQNINNYEAQLAVLNDEAYAGLDNGELQAQANAKYKEYELAQVAFAKDPTCEALLATSAPLVAAAEAAETQRELVSDINSIYYAVDYTPNFTYYWDYTAVAYSYTGSQKYVSYYSDVRINEYNKLMADRVLASQVESAAADLGKTTDTKDADTAYGRLAAANDQLKTANDQLATANKMPETTDAEKAAKEAAIDAANAAIDTAEEAVALAKDNLTYYQNAYDEAVADQKEFNEAIAALDVDACNKAAADLEAALEAQQDAEDAWNEAKSSINDLYNEYVALNYLANNSATDIEQQKLNLQAQIDDAKAAIETNNYNWGNAERTLEQAKIDIENLKGQIEAQTIIVNTAKAALEAALGTDEETPAEEEQPAA